LKNRFLNYRCNSTARAALFKIGTLLIVHGDSAQPAQQTHWAAGDCAGNCRGRTHTTEPGNHALGPTRPPKIRILLQYYRRLVRSSNSVMELIRSLPLAFTCRLLPPASKQPFRLTLRSLLAAFPACWYPRVAALAGRGSTPFVYSYRDYARSFTRGCKHLWYARQLILAPAPISHTTGRRAACRMPCAYNCHTYGAMR